MKVGRLRRVVMERETGKGVVGAIGKLVKEAREVAKIAAKAPELIKEIPRLQAYGYASNAVFRNVEIHRMEHFMRLIDLGLEEEDPARGCRLIETVEDIAKAYGRHRDTPLQREILEHVKHVGRAKSPEMLLALGEVMRHVGEVDYSSLEREHAETLLKALSLARTPPSTGRNAAERHYKGLMLALKEHLEMYRKGQKEEALKRLRELLSRG